jgi:flagellin
MSVNTNAGALIALQNLASTNSQLGVVQSRINTGMKVASTKDDSATFAIAQNLRADIGGINAVKSSLDRAKSALDVGISAAEAISDTLVQMKEKAVAASDAGLDADSRTALQNDFNALAEQLVSYVNSASFNGTNVLKKNEGSISAILDADATTTLSVTNKSIDDTGGALEEFMTAGASAGDVSVVATTTWANATAAGTSAGDVDTAIESMNTVLSSLGSASRKVDGQLAFTQKLSDTIETGIGNLVDADLAKESAKLQSLQVKQQLGLQALSIANQAPQSVLSQFR